MWEEAAYDKWYVEEHFPEVGADVFRKFKYTQGQRFLVDYLSACWFLGEYPKEEIYPRDKYEKYLQGDFENIYDIRAAKKSKQK